MSKAFGASRYERGGDDDYINCPFNKAEYEAFINELVNAEGAIVHDLTSMRAVCRLKNLLKEGLTLLVSAL